ncbi:MAG: sulfotransferase [Pseudomonadota bacterium]
MANAEPSLTAQVQALMRSGQLGPARSALEERLSDADRDVEALYLLAVVQRYQGEHEAAHETLAGLFEIEPQNGRAHQERGHLMKAIGRHEAAIDSYAAACRHNPALLASWRALEGLLLATQQSDRARKVAAQRRQLEQLPKPLLAVHELIAQGRLLQAEERCRSFLRRAPRHVEGMRLLAQIAMQLGVLDDAEFLLESAVALRPDHIPAQIDYITALRKRQQFQKAQTQARALLERDPQNVQFQSIFAVESMQRGDYETALAQFERILAQLPDDPVTLTSKGHALKTCGRYDDAVSAYGRALDAQPRHGEAWYSLANLKTYRFTSAQLAQMEAQLAARDLPHQDRVYLCFAMGKAQEDRNAYEASFAHYAEGNEIKRRQSRYDAQRMHAELMAQQRVCTPAFFEARAHHGHPAADPIFVVGLPRAGSTLLEQILSSHSQVDGTLELPNVLTLSQQLRRRPRPEGAGDESAVAGAYPAILTDLSAHDCARFGEQYIEQTQIHRHGAPRFVDKMPNNFRHIGLIHLMLPNAKIIDARREAMACCFSAFKQLFAEGQEFSYSLRDVARYYADYERLMEHWDKALPGRVLRVRHEEVVQDLEGQVRRLLDFCELPFEAQCLRYWETARAVRTPSSEQVRRPIDRQSTEQWRAFAPWLGPLREALDQP